MSQRVQVVLSDPVALQPRELAAGADTPTVTLAAQSVRNRVALAAEDGKIRPLRSSPVFFGGNETKQACRCLCGRLSSHARRRLRRFMVAATRCKSR
jgi:hypothetical protein